MRAGARTDLPMVLFPEGTRKLEFWILGPRAVGGVLSMSFWPQNVQSRRGSLARAGARAIWGRLERAGNQI